MTLPSSNPLESCLCAPLDHGCSILFRWILPLAHSNPWLILQSLLVGLILSGSESTPYTLPQLTEAGTGLSTSKSLLECLAPR